MVSMELSEEEARRITESRQQQTAVAERRVLIGFVIDESGSMANCVEDTIGGYNHFLDDQAKVPGVALASCLQFNSTKPQRLLQPLPPAQHPLRSLTAIFTHGLRSLPSSHARRPDPDFHSSPAPRQRNCAGRNG